MKRLLPNTATIVAGENGDLQFKGTGDPIIDLVSRGADSYLQKLDKSNIEKYRDFVLAAASTDRVLSNKIARYFKDREQGQGLKEQPLLYIAILSDQLSCDEILSILSVNPAGIKGSVDLDKMDLMDTTRILAWHHYLYDKSRKLGYGTCKAFSEMFKASPNALEQVLTHKGSTVAYDESNKVQVSIIDVLGIIQGFGNLSEELTREFREYLFPRYRGGQFNAKPTSDLGRAHYNFFTRKQSTPVPVGITLPQVLAHNDKDAIKWMFMNSRLSNAQVKVNFGTILKTLNDKERETLLKGRKFNLYPHDILGMARAFHTGTANTQANPAGVDLCNDLLISTVERYKQTAKKKVIFLADTSGSMHQPLSAKSTIMQSDFAAFMSYFASFVSGHGVFGTWDTDARLYSIKKNRINIRDFFELNTRSDCGTDVVNAIQTTADFFKSNGLEAPGVICLISDMQFNSVDIDGDVVAGSGMSAATLKAIGYYKSQTGVLPELVYWNVRAKTSPSISQPGVMFCSGFSANTADIIFGAINDSVNKEKQLEPKDLIAYIEKTYK